MPSINSLPFVEALTDKDVPGQTRSSPPRVSRRLAACSPAFIAEPLLMLKVLELSVTEPCTVASDAETSPIFCAYEARVSVPGKTMAAMLAQTRFSLGEKTKNTT